LKKRGKIATLIVWGLQLYAAALFINASFMKFYANPKAVAVFTRIDMEPQGRILIGVLELIVALMLILPHTSIFGALIGMGIMLAAIIGHFTSIGMTGLHMAIPLFICFAVIIFIRRHESSLFKNMLDS